MSCSPVSAASYAAYLPPVQPVSSVQYAPKDSDGDQDGDAAPVKAATPPGVGVLLDVSA
jgi:hypothetical protein